VHDYRLTAEGELERLSHIARQTLGFYRDTGSPTEVCLHELMETVLSVYSSELLIAGITIDRQFHDQRTVSVRKGEILQVFSNIVTNAADAMRQGGVLSISTRQISESSISDEEHVQVWRFMNAEHRPISKSFIYSKRLPIKVLLETRGLNTST
jgi:signal transduction histidine kinase